MKPCRLCAESIQDAAVVCRYCGSHVDTLLVRAGRWYLRLVASEFLLTSMLVAIVGYSAFLVGSRGAHWLLAVAVGVLAVVTWFLAQFGPFRSDNFAMYGYLEQISNVVKKQKAAAAAYAYEAVATKRFLCNVTLGVGVFVGLKTNVLLIFVVVWFGYGWLASRVDQSFARWASAMNDLTEEQLQGWQAQWGDKVFFVLPPGYRL